MEEVRRCGAHEIVVEDNMTLVRAVVEIFADKVVNCYEFRDELPMTEWLGGRIDIDALVGVIDVDGMVTVNNGAMTIGSATHAMNAGGSITIGGNLVAGDAVANAGDVVVNASGNQGFSMVADNSATNSGENNAALNIYGNIVNTQLDGNAHNLTLGAGVITIGVIEGSSTLGLNEEEFIKEYQSL